MKASYLNDKVFLKKLDEIKNKHILTKLLLLDEHNRIEEELMGYAKEGSSVGIDGSSAVRRTCSLTLIADSDTAEKNARIQNLLSINRKMKLQIGIKNMYKNTFSEYAEEEVFWFPLGTYFINTVSYSNSLDGFSISLNLSDKMCLLNGENGGIIPADTTLNTMETYVPEMTEGMVSNLASGESEQDREEEDAIVMTGRMVPSQGEQVPIAEIITELVNHFGNEDLNNIVLDLPENVRLCQGWGGNSYKLYCDYESTEGTDKTKIKDLTSPKTYYLNDEVKNQSLNADNFKATGNISNSINEKDRQYLILRKKEVKIGDEWYDYYVMKDGPLADPDTSNYGDAESAEENEQASAAANDSSSQEEEQTFKYSDGVSASDLVLLNAVGDIGFTLTDLVYPNSSNDFIAAKGSPITEPLDSIKQVLENYEYFYDVEGKFRFQEIKNYLNTSQSTDLLESLKAQKEGDEYETTNYSFDKYRDKAVYDFTNSPLIIDISNDPQYSLVKNDFIIWGTNGAGLPIRYHVAIDDIPDANWCYEGYWMYNKMVCLDTSMSGMDTAEGSYTNTLTYLYTSSSKEEFPIEGMLGVYYYALPDYESDDNCDKVYYWNGSDYYILYSNGSGTYAFVLDTDEEETLWNKYGTNGGSNEWTQVQIEDGSNNTSNYYTIQITENNKEKEAAQVALDHQPYVRVITVKGTDELGNETETLVPEVVNGGRGYQVRRVRYNTTNDWRSSIFLEGKINELDGTANNNYYYAELQSEWPKIVDIYPPEREGSNVIGSTDAYTDDDIEADGITLELKDSLDLTQATYYLDILTPSDRIKKFSIPSIGRRSDVYGETGVNCVFENDLPPYIYIDNQMKDFYKTAQYDYQAEGQETPTTFKEDVLTDFSLELMEEQIKKHTGAIGEQDTDMELSANQAAFLQKAYDRICAEIKAATELGYNPVVLYHSQYKKLQGGGTACSAYEQAKNLIYSGTCYNEKVTVTMMPVYYLEPNTRIRLQDTASGVNGDYIIDSIDLPLDGTGTMSLVCSRALDKM